jgi:hypothetical protein
MLRYWCAIVMLIAACVAVGQSAQAIEQKHGILMGEILKLDAGARTVVVKVADGTVHTFHFVKGTAVHGGQAVASGATDTFHGLKEGSQVAVHYTAKGADETAEEIDDIGHDGLKATDGTITHIDRGAKELTVKTADGTEQTYRLTDSAAKDAGADIAKGTEKSTKVTVYYTEEAGRKVAHFFKRAI